VGKTGKELSLMLFDGTIDAKLEVDTWWVLEKHFPEAEIALHTFALPFLHTIRTLDSFEEDGVLLDITGEVTDCLVLRQSALSETFTVPLGTRSLMRQLEDAGRSLAQAESTIKLYLEDALGGKDREAVEKAFLSFEKKWIESMAKNMLAIAREHPLPQSAYLLTDPGSRAWFSRTLGKLDFAPATLTNDVFHVIELSSEELRDENLPNIEDPYLLILLKYYSDRVHQFELS